MPEQYLRACSRALWDSDLIASRLTLFLAEALWAVMLLWPGDTFDRPTYTLMAHVAPEWVWALVFGVSAFIQLHVVIGERFHRPCARAFSAWNAALWVFVVVGMMGSVYPPPAAIGGEIALAVLAVWIFVRPYFLAAMHWRANERIA